MAVDPGKKMRFSLSNRLLRGILIFTGLFILFALVQFEIFTHQRRAAMSDKLERWANQIAQELKYSTKWDLNLFSNADYEANHWIVLDRDGLIISLGGFVPELQLRVDLKNQTPGIQTVTVPETGESWRLFVKRARGGMVFLGVTPPNNITNVDDRLENNAAHFGSSFADALRVKIHDIDAELNYALIDDEGLVRSFDGGIPLKVVSHRNFPTNEMAEIKTNAGTTYGLLSKPFRDGSGREVGSITVFDELTSGPWQSSKMWTTNLLASTTLSLIGTFVSIPLLKRNYQPQKLVEAALKNGESATVEFKEGLRWDQWSDAKDQAGSGRKKAPDAEGIAIKNIAAFLNSETGGTLFIGIADDKRVVGLEGDYESLGKRENRDKDRDRFQVHLGNVLSQRIGRDLTSLCVKYSIIAHDGNDVCVIDVSPSPRPVFISEGEVKTFYIRQGASTAPLDVEKTVTYVERRWPKTLWKKLGKRIRTVRT